jgi:hypothetical protein
VDVSVVPPPDEEDESADAVELDDSPGASPDGWRDSRDSRDSPDVFRDAPDDSPEESDFEDPDEAVPASARRAGALVARRSVFAQPVPLKWIVGGTNARATGPPHWGHWCGPASLIPRNTSNRWPQEPHT